MTHRIQCTAEFPIGANVVGVSFLATPHEFSEPTTWEYLIARATSALQLAAQKYFTTTEEGETHDRAGDTDASRPPDA